MRSNAKNKLAEGMGAGGKGKGGCNNGGAGEMAQLGRCVSYEQEG